ncbi:MAG: MarR family transcriptional regulator [Microbacterium sp.]
MVCFALYSASRGTTQAYRRLLEPWGLTYPQYLVLVELWDLGPRTVRELGADLALDSGTLSPLLRRMADAGYLTRSRDRADGRVVTVRLTERGEALRDELEGIPLEVGSCLGLNLESARELLDVLHRVTGSLHVADEPTADATASA